MSFWSGYLLLTVNTSVPPEHIATAEGVVSLAGRSPITNLPNEISLIRKSLDGSKYIWKLSRKDSDVDAPTLEDLKEGLLENTPLTQAEVDAMVLNLEVKTLPEVHIIAKVDFALEESE